GFIAAGELAFGDIEPRRPPAGSIRVAIALRTFGAISLMREAEVGFSDGARVIDIDDGQVITREHIAVDTAVQHTFEVHRPGRRRLIATGFARALRGAGDGAAAAVEEDLAGAAEEDVAGGRE